MVRRKPLLFAGILLYVVTFQLVYLLKIVPIWGYDGYVAGSRPQYVATLALFGALIPALWLPVKVRRPSQVVYWLLYVLVIVPVIIVGSHKTSAPFGPLILFWGTLLLSFFLIGQIHRLPLANLQGIPLPPPVFWAGALVITVGGYAYLSTKFRLHLGIESVTDVYDTREAYQEGRLASSALVAYAVNWNGYVLNPLYIGFGIVNRKSWMIAGGVVGQLLLFSLTGFKQVFFSALLIVAILFALKKKGERFGLTVIWGMVGVVLAAVLIDLLVDSIVLTNLFVRRLIATPGVNTAHFFEFFSEHPKALLGHSFLGAWVDYPYSQSPSNLMGAVYQGSAETSANANVWADAFANFGYLGMVGFSLVLAAVMWVFDSLSRDRDIRLASLLLGVPALALVNAALFSTLLSHGLLAALAAVFFLPQARSRSAQRTLSTTKAADDGAYRVRHSPREEPAI